MSTLDDSEGEDSSSTDKAEEISRREALRLYHREYSRRRAAEDPVFRERKNRSNREYYRRRWDADPAFRERKRLANKRPQENRQADQKGAVPRLGRRRGAIAIDAHVGARIRDRRRALRLPVESLSRLLDVNPRQISLYERGVTTLSASNLYLLAVHLGVNVDWFFADLGDAAAAKSEGSWSEPDDPDGIAFLFSRIPDRISRLRFLSLVQSFSESRDPDHR